MKTHVGVNGACGRMGQRIVTLVEEAPDLALTAALESANHPLVGRDIGEVAGLGRLGVSVRHDLPFDTHLDVLIDFSTPEGTMAVLPLCRDRRIPIVIATTGHNAVQKDEIESAAQETAVLVAPNLSLVVNVLFKLVSEAARLLAGKGYDVEIIERHHRFKKDSPSGTALHFARLVQEAMGQTEMRHGREGLVGERTATEIGMHAVRAGDNVGEHTILFSTLGETLELVHKGHSRDSYARGAVLAARYLANRPAGRYTMNDVLGL